MTQDKLAKSVGVSRSLIAKLETGQVDASYKKVKNIFDTLEQLETELGKTKTVTVGEIHNTKVEYANVSEPVYAVWKRMDRNAFSQVPVKDSAGRDIVGSITERAINRKLLELDSPEKLRNIQVRELMEEPFPTVSVKTSIIDIIPLLQTYQAAITSERGRPVGIVTNADVVNATLKIIQ